MLLLPFFCLFLFYKYSFALQCYAAAYPKAVDLPKAWDSAYCESSQCLMMRKQDNSLSIAGVIYACDYENKCANSINKTTTTVDGFLLSCCGSDLCNSKTTRPSFYLLLSILSIILS